MARKTRNKLSVDFEGFNSMRSKLEELDGDVKGATESALKVSHQIVTRKVTDAMKPHNDTGETSASIIREAEVQWSGSVAEVGAGFDIENGGLPSIFLMYGTKLHGQPHITPDKNLFNAVYGSKTKKEVREAQKAVFFKRIERAMK